MDPYSDIPGVAPLSPGNIYETYTGMADTTCNVNLDTRRTTSPQGGIIPYKCITDSSNQRNHALELPRTTGAPLNSFSTRKPSPHDMEILASLANASLWKEFQNLETEMVTTINGRYLFPQLRFCVSGLDPEAVYSMHVEFKRVDDYYYKYSRVEQSWQRLPDPKIHEKSILEPSSVHPNSPATGQDWQLGKVDFSNLRIFKDKQKISFGVVLQSHRKYEPCLVVTEHSVTDLSTINSVAFSFPQARFITVTSYCDTAVADMKTKYNRYAIHAKKLRRITRLSPSSSSAANNTISETEETLDCSRSTKRHHASSDTCFSFSSPDSLLDVSSSPESCIFSSDSYSDEFSRSPKRRRSTPDTYRSDCSTDTCPTPPEFSSNQFDSFMTSTPLHYPGSMYHHPEFFLPTRDNLYCPYHPYSSPVPSCQCPWHISHTGYHGNNWFYNSTDQSDYYRTDCFSGADDLTPSSWQLTDRMYLEGLLRPFDIDSSSRCL